MNLGTTSSPWVRTGSRRNHPPSGLLSAGRLEPGAGHDTDRPGRDPRFREDAVWTKSKPEFTALDRCDRCGARASMRATLPAGVLLFCYHHTRDHHAKLVELGALIEVA